MWALKLALYLWGCISSVQATSQGVATTTCDPWFNMGCSTWYQGNRLNCTDPTKGPMPWASKPVRSTAYSVRTADGAPAQDPTVYIPGAMMTIYVRALQYSLPFRGILLTAYDKTPKPVGSWVFPADDQALFWSPPQCNQSAMHNSATVKPYLVLIRFLAPPSGTGAITIRALIKYGVANNGAFYLPMTDLVLQEQYTDPQWFAANAGETCSTCCARNGRSGFDGVTQTSLFSSEAFRVAVEKKVLCNLPLLTSCSPSAPVIDDNNFCYMRESNCTPNWRVTTAVPNSRNLCACVVYSSASSVSISRWVLGALLGLSVLSSQKRHLFIYLVLACVLMPSVRAHNWLHTPGRASTQASTIFPCQGRKATDLHAQLSRTQNFVTKWAVGHDRNSYFVLINEKDQDMLARSDFEDMVDDYLARGTQAPYNSPNLANDPTWMRYHGTYHGTATDPLTGTYTNNAKLPGSLFEAEVPSGDANYLTHPRSNQPFHLFKYTDAARANDIRLEYASAEYPWIEMAFRAPHLYHIPEDFNTFRTQVPGRSGDGHYILHWRWSGYFDCIDLDVRSASVANVYGVDSAGYIYNRIDHCQYLTPNQLVTPCVEVGWDAQACVDRLPGWMVDNRLGVNVVPFANPSAVYKGFNKMVNIPWNNGVCSDNSWMALSGTVTESFIDFNNAATFKTTKQVGKVCTSTMQPCNGGAGACVLGGGDYVPPDGMLNFKRAIALCVGHRACVGVSVQNDGNFAPNTIPTDAATHNILLCTSTNTASNTNFTSYFPTGLQTFSDITGAVTKAYSFVPSQFASSLTAPASNNFRDFGAPYANSMGWSCNTSVDCPWCCAGYDCGNNAPSGNNPYGYGTFQWMQGYCDSNSAVARQWEVAVPAGLYDVTVHSDLGTSDPTAWVSGCNVEGALMQDSTDEPPQPATITRRVEVLDGRLTLDGEGAAQLGCNAINWITVKQIRTSWDEVWLPAVTNPWWQMALPTPQPIGVVQLQAINYYYEINGGTRQLNCASWWMFRGSRCYDGRPLGWFNASNEGAIVGVSSSPNSCSSSGCSGTVCGYVRKGVDEWSIWQQYVDCKGVVGQYVWVYLPGTARSLVFNVKVFRSQPDIPVDRQNTTKVCYGVEAHPQTATNPEFTITTDPEDPIFHSTCFSREKNITWLATTPPMTGSAPVPRWRFNQHCLDCSTYHHNAQSLGTTELPAPWLTDNGNCANCDMEGNPPPIQKTKLPWKLTWLGSFDTSKNTCPATTQCAKNLAMGGRSNEAGDDWTQQVMDEVDCQLLAERDPECQPVAQYGRRWWDGSQWQYYERSCVCWKNLPCCGRPTPWSWDPPHEGSEVYSVENSAAPDASCTTGIKSGDNKMCCKSYCKDSMGNSVCGWTNNPWGACYQSVSGGGGCCNNNTVQLCSAAGPPCLLP